MNLKQYEYLWDGSEDGWVLHHTDHVVWEITYLFSPEGPSKDEMVALHKIVPEFKDLPLSTVFKHLKGIQDYKDPSAYGNLEAKRLEDEIAKFGLKYKMSTMQIGGYLPVSKDSMVLIIEDDQTSTAVCKKMLEAGVPVVSHTHID